MEEFSPRVTSRQAGPHPRLAETVRKHLDHPWKRTPAYHSKEAFQALAPVVDRWSGSLVLDTGCGTGMSTVALARRHPQSLVLGIDKSEVRLGRAPVDLPPNAMLLRMDLGDFWLLARAAGWTFECQYFFYPNPWPKPEHRMRRWAFHPAWPTAVACGGTFEVRTNWDVYAREMASAYGLVTGAEPTVVRWNPTVPETLFEKKYQASGHDLWRWVSGIKPGSEH